MKELLGCLLACTLAGAWAGTLILLLKKLLKDRLSPLWHCYVWLVVMALLLIPLPTVTRAETIPSGEILFVESDPTYVPEQELRETELVVEQEIREPEPVLEQETAHSVPTTKISQIPQTPVEKSAGEESASVSENKSVEKSAGFAFRFAFPDWGWTVLGLLWLGGTVFFLSNHLRNYRRFVSKLNHTSRPAKEATLRLLKETEEELGIRHPVELAVTLLPITPMIVGLRNPTLYLPEEELPEEQMKLIFIHELCHYKYGDLYYKELATILRSIHWFNPLCAVMVEDIDFSCELLCDRRVTKQIGAGRSREYSALLLELLGVSIRRSNPSATFSMNKTALKRRLSLIMKPNNTSKTLCMLLTAALVLTGAACSAAVAPEIQVEEEPAAKIEAPEQGEKIADLKAQNNDVVGWLQIPDTEIDNAVLHTTDNETYYRRDELMHYSQSGSYFADYECTFGPTSDDLGRSTLIYGHNLSNEDDKDGQRFSQLFHFADEKWAKEHPYIYFSTPEEDMVWEVFAASYVTTDFNYIQILKDNEVSDEQITAEQMLSIVNEAREQSVYDYSNVEVTGDDKILTLSTNSYEYGQNNNGRFIVMAKLVTENNAPVKVAIIPKDIESAANYEKTVVSKEEILLTSTGGADVNKGALFFPLPEGTVYQVTETYNPEEPSHLGLDLTAEAGTELYASIDGEVVRAGYQDGQGNTVQVWSKKANLIVTYDHCEELLVQAGDTVKAGQVIATLGKTGNVTGNCLHIEICKDSIKVNTLDPARFFPELHEYIYAPYVEYAHVWEEITNLPYAVKDFALARVTAAVHVLEMTEDEHAIPMLKEYLNQLDSEKKETLANWWFDARTVAQSLLTDSRDAILEESGYGAADLSAYSVEGLIDLDDKVVSVFANSDVNIKHASLAVRKLSYQHNDQYREVETSIPPLENPCVRCGGTLYYYETFISEYIYGYNDCVDGAEDHGDQMREREQTRQYQCLDCGKAHVIKTVEKIAVHLEGFPSWWELNK